MSKKESRAVFLDRDGVINEVVFREGRPASPRSLEEFHLVEGAAAALKRLQAAGYRLFVVSNQPDVARGLLNPTVLEEMGKRVRAALPVERVLTCIHDDHAGCLCRKPRPGMLHDVASHEGIALSRSFLIGDSWKDVEAGRAAGCTSILLQRPYNRDIQAHHVVGSLDQAVELIVEGAGMGIQSAGYVNAYLREVGEIAAKISSESVSRIITALIALRARGGRLFILGVGGSAGNASHAVNDFRKIADIEAYAPTDNVSELTARINDAGWDSSYADWLRGSRLGPNDAIFVLSVGGGNIEKKISTNLVEAIRYARAVGAKVLGIVGRDGGYTAQVADACVVIPTINPATVTPHAEAFQAVVWHLIVSHPDLLAHEMKWESVK